MNLLSDLERDILLNSLSTIQILAKALNTNNFSQIFHFPGRDFVDAHFKHYACLSFFYQIYTTS